MKRLLLLWLVPCLWVDRLTAEDVLLADFEGEGYGEWQVEGTAFGRGPVSGALPDQMPVSGFRGRSLVNSYHGGDASTGSLTSPAFRITRKSLAFLIGGGRSAGQVGMELVIDGAAVRTATGRDAEQLLWHTWDVADLIGREARLRIFDRATGGWGHVLVDHIVQTDVPRAGTGTWRLDEYQRSAEYYRERYRPQFHFSPPLNWMNDPNGLVFHDGEYHLFYQHNPHGNAWGHMSWGHAVSGDLVHWKHLPIALHEEYGVMIFSGCCVVDHQNTSGFGRENEPPLVAVYTGHGHGRQTQDLAYSTDRGRSWTKYAGNPVLDLGEAEFRDPKVFWHAPTGRWVMVVSLAPQKRVRFYSSPDLKQWTHLSDFGPAGAAEKPNWECPDLFELPIENEPGETRWVLEVDMGSGAVAGGSGGEYFVGRFDGERFVPDEQPPPVRWVDYGRDFYAPVSWSDIPPTDGRRIWIGWMNNWETCLHPTDPWRSAMSIPRSLSLRRTAEGLRLVQTPIRELQSLRGTPVRMATLSLPPGETPLADAGIEGDRLEIIAEFDLGDATEVGLNVRVGEGERTVIGYDARTREVFVDRSRSGESAFHPRFAGRHAGPLAASDGRIRLHVFVDASSVEVFAADGAMVLTDCIFPAPDSRGVSVSTNGTGTTARVQAWPLKSIWFPDPEGETRTPR